MAEESYQEYVKRIHETEPKQMVLKVIEENPDKTQAELLRIAMKECRGYYNPSEIKSLIKKLLINE